MGITAHCREHLEELCPGAFTFLEDEERRTHLSPRASGQSLGEALQSSAITSISSRSSTLISATNPSRELTRWSALRSRKPGYSSTAAKTKARTRSRRSSCVSSLPSTNCSSRGGILRVGGQIVAFTIGSPINETTFGVHIEKANRDYDGAFTVINRLFASTIPERYTYVNRERLRYRGAP